MRCFRRRETNGGESKKALEDATENLRRVQARHPEVSEVAQASKRIRERNHFAEQLTDLIWGGTN